MPSQQFGEKSLRVSNLHAHQRKKALSRNCSNHSVSSNRSIGSQNSQHNLYQLKEGGKKDRPLQPSLSKSIYFPDQPYFKLRA